MPTLRGLRAHWASWGASRAPSRALTAWQGPRSRNLPVRIGSGGPPCGGRFPRAGEAARRQNRAGTQCSTISKTQRKTPRKHSADFLENAVRFSSKRQYGLVKMVASLCASMGRKSLRHIARASSTSVCVRPWTLSGRSRFGGRSGAASRGRHLPLGRAPSTWTTRTSRCSSRPTRASHCRAHARMSWTSG